MSWQCRFDVIMMTFLLTMILHKLFLLIFHRETTKSIGNEIRWKQDSSTAT